MIQIRTLIGLILLVLLGGCQVQPPGGSPISPQTLGTAVDQINLAQENNAEAAKLIVYTHEFEINLQDSPDNENARPGRPFEFKNPSRIHGLGLNPDGLEHVQQVASFLLQQPPESRPAVIVERSRTSKLWETEHRYPVHFNAELDELRRQLIVNLLFSSGIDNANDVVVVAPAFSTGLTGEEAASAYRNSRFQSSGVNSGGGGGFGGGFGGSGSNFGGGGFGGIGR